MVSFNWKKSFKINVFTWDPIIWTDVWLNYNVCITNSSYLCLTFSYLKMSKGNLPCIDVALATICSKFLLTSKIIIVFVWSGQSLYWVKRQKMDLLFPNRFLIRTFRLYVMKTTFSGKMARSLPKWENNTTLFATKHIFVYLLFYVCQGVKELRRIKAQNSKIFTSVRTIFFSIPAGMIFKRFMIVTSYEYIHLY